jgi:hypothetical protein
VYLCTTADREYAWEAWRLLDPQASVFPLDQLAWRMLCVAHPQKKDLLNVLRKGQVDAAAARGEVPRCASDPQLVTDKGELVGGCKLRRGFVSQKGGVYTRGGFACWAGVLRLQVM